jgi:lipase chaperone LimK
MWKEDNYNEFLVEKSLLMQDDQDDLTDEEKMQQYRNLRLKM